MNEGTYCTSPDCHRPSGLYLCRDCIIELDDLLKQVPLLVVALDPGLLAWKVTKAPGSGSETRNTNKAGSQAPLNIDVDQLRDWLRTLLGLRAYELAADNPAAGQYLDMARIWVNNANTITHGADEPEPDHAANRERVANIAPPMPTRQLLPWLRVNSKIKITSQNIRDWVRRGHLKPVTREPQPTYHPHEVINAWHERNNP